MKVMVRRRKEQDSLTVSSQNGKARGKIKARDTNSSLSKSFLLATRN